MEKKDIQDLIAKFNTGRATPADLEKIEWLLEEGSLSLEELHPVTALEDRIAQVKFPAPPADLDHRFYQMLALEKKSKSSFSWRRFFSWPELAPRLALASVTLAIGIGIGYMAKPASAPNQNIEMLSQEVSSLKEMMMLSLLEKESATERLKAVSLTQEMDMASVKVTGALLNTLNEDDNVNVRLAAVEALKPYVRDSHVREELIRSIGKQQSPLVQVALAEMMAELKVKSSVKELEKIMKSDRTPADVKNKIKQSIDVLI
jgi:hypothetical protein